MIHLIRWLSSIFFSQTISLIYGFQSLRTLAFYSVLFLQPFFKHHTIEKVPDCLESDYSVNREVSFSTRPSVSYARIIKKIWHYGISIFLVFFISLAIYPAVTVLVESEGKGKGNAWNGKHLCIYLNAL